MANLAPSIGGHVCAWLETFLVHGPGDVQGSPIILDDEFRTFVWRAYELRSGGQRQYRRAFLSRPKGRGKSELAAMLAATELCGPVRFDRFADAGETCPLTGYVFAAGEPIGKAVTAPEVLCIATEEGQAGFVYQAARYMLRTGHAADSYPLDAGLTRTYLAGGGSMEPVTAAANSKDGGKSTFVAADETHLWITRELRALYATVKRNIVKRRTADGWMLETSTAYRPGEQSVAEASLDVWRMIESGELADPTLLVDHRQGADDVDIYDVAELRAALVEAYGEAAAWTNLEGIISEIFDPATDEADNRRYWLNQVVRATDQWMDPAAWDKAEAPQMIGAGEAIALGFDGSIRDDATALIGCRISDGHLFVIDVWERKDTRDLRTVAKYDAPMWEVDRRAVDAAVAHTMRHYRVVRLYADNWQWQDALDRWAAEWPGVVVSWPTNRERAMVHALERLHTAVNTGECTHAGDPVLTRHVLNARRRPVRAGDVIAKERDGSPKKIDAAVAATLAYEARADAVAAGATRPKRSRVPVSF
jgi:phage terminase large subunit-like protein